MIKLEIVLLKGLGNGPSLKFYRVKQFTEIGGINAQIRSNVFVWHKLKQMRAALAK